MWAEGEAAEGGQWSARVQQQVSRNFHSGVNSNFCSRSLQLAPLITHLYLQYKNQFEIIYIGINAGNWVGSAQDRDYWRALVNAALNLRELVS